MPVALADEMVFAHMRGQRLMRDDSGFVIFQRSDGTQVACQLSTILFVTRGDRGSILHFGGGTQLNLRDEFDDVIAMLGASKP